MVDLEDVVRMAKALEEGDYKKVTALAQSIGLGEDVYEIQSIHQLHTDYERGVQSSTPQEFLSRITEDNDLSGSLLSNQDLRATFMLLSDEETNHDRVYAIVRLADDRPYAEKIEQIYLTQIKPFL
ncbi:MAG: hypothetical protein AABX51_05415 [Nanoarchaeota archaeon]